MAESPSANGEADPVVVTAVSAEDASRLLNVDPAQAEARARETLRDQPDNASARLLLGAALRRQKKCIEAVAVLEPLARGHPDMPVALFELGMTYAELRDRNKAVEFLARTVDLAPAFGDAWYALGDQWALLQRQRERRAPLPQVSAQPRRDPRWREAALALRGDRLDRGEELLRDILEGDATNARATKLLADSALRRGRRAEAESLLARCLAAAPEMEAARLRYATILFLGERPLDALPHIDELLQRSPSNALFHFLKAETLVRLDEFTRAVPEYEAALAIAPDRPGAWLGYGRVLRYLGRQAGCIAALRKAIELLPSGVEPYWRLATIKQFRFEPALIDVLRRQLARGDLTVQNRAQLHFALGRALEDSARYAEAFENHRRSHLLQQSAARHDPETLTRFVRRSKELFTRAFLRERSGAGAPSGEPIFIVGMPRSGSTLVEQILSAHPAVEGAGELGDMKTVVLGLREDAAARGHRLPFPDVLAALQPDELRSMGEKYLARARRRRKLPRPHFTDKMPGNFAYIGMIQLILPNARIVDVRRHPLDACLSCFRNYFPAGQAFMHDLRDLGRFYREYVELMAHFDDVNPGRVHRVIYERLVEDPETEIRKLLGYLGLPFEEQCLRFHAVERAVLTISSEQVRTPLYRESLGYWRHYEPWLQPLKDALGFVLASYPEPPKFFPRLQASMTMQL